MATATKLDFSSRNSRLEHEHNRLVAEYFKRGDVIADIMAGVGPFVVPPAAKAGCTVYSND
jgi:tRNA (guanine37-N1)-methyltransferase